VANKNGIVDDDFDINVHANGIDADVNVSVTAARTIKISLPISPNPH
jgi:hypothetical protein